MVTRDMIEREKAYIRMLCTMEFSPIWCWQLENLNGAGI